MIKALSIIFLILGWFYLLHSPILKQIEKDKSTRRSILLLGVGTILTFFSFFS